MKKIELLIHPEPEEKIRDEFFRFIDFAKEKNFNKLDVVFGDSWIGKPQITQIILSPDELYSRVQEYERLGKSEIGEDDVRISIIGAQLYYNFCHEMDIHIEAPEDSEHLKVEKKRYESLGWEVIERLIEK